MVEVILVNTNDEEIGRMEKMAVHQSGLLHRAFSVFIFNRRGEMLLQQRASNKYHSPNLWSNACCSHPAPGEDILVAAQRRLQEEMGFTTNLTPAFHFIYKIDFDNGLTEHEFDHVFIGTYDGEIAPDHNEVKDFCFMKVEAIKESLDLYQHKYSSWFNIAFQKMEDHLANSQIINQ